jgi:hypothetical protein
MEKSLQKHITIRTLLGLIPISLFAMITFTDKQSGNDFIGSDFVPMMLGFGSLFIWFVYVTFETVFLFIKKQNRFAFANIILIIIISLAYLLELYLSRI